MHKRAAIRKAVVAALTGAPELSGRVSSSRVRRTQDTELPVALVYSLAEPAQEMDLARSLSRKLSIVVELRVKATDALDDAIDDLAVVVEETMSVDPKFGMLALDSYLESTQIGLNGETEYKHGVALLTYAVTYRTLAGQPSA